MRGAKWILGGVVALLLGCQRPPPDEGATRITFLSVGQGDCTVIQHDGRTVLIDAGPKSRGGDAGKRIIVPKLRSLGIGSLDMILLSHPDLDHVGGTAAILRAYPGTPVAISGEFQHDPKMRQTIREWRIDEANLRWLPAETSFRLNNLQFLIENPAMRPQSGDNDGSMFVRVGRSPAAVFSGDAPTSVENEMIGRADWRGELLHCGHHGSRTSTGDPWLETVRPVFGVISVGRNNRYGHPTRQVLDRLIQHRVQTLRTDRDGDIAFEVRDGHFVRIREYAQP